MAVDDAYQASGVELTGTSGLAGSVGVRDSAATGFAEAVEELVGCRDPLLIGVRHHSPALSVAMPHLLAAADPDVLLVELPPEAEPWLPWLVHEQAQAPLALALAIEDGPLAFYPFADFSPELVALRWAARRGVPVVACDRPVACQDVADDPDHDSPDESAPDVGADATAGQVTAQWRDLLTRHGGHHELWDRLVETASAGADPERVRRAALAVGYAYRLSEGQVDRDTRLREAWMRHRLGQVVRDGYRRPAAVIGSFHAAALWRALPRPAGPPETVPDTALHASLVPYSDRQLDSRSGYPAGIRDPAWQYEVLCADGDPAELRRRSTRLLTRVAVGVRAAGHPAGPGEITEMVRIAGDLATLRGYAAPGRRELIEVLTTVLAQGDLMGRGRAVAKAAEAVLVGTRAGRLAPGSPRSALAAWLDAHLRRLELPARLGEARALGGDRPRKGAEHEYRFEPLRSELDTERVVTLRRMGAARIAYAVPLHSVGIGGAGAVAELWRIQFTAGTAATIEAAAVHGPRLEDCARTALIRRRAALSDDASTAAPGSTTGPATPGIRPEPSSAGGDTDPAELLDWLQTAAECALPDLVADGLRWAGEVLSVRAGFAQLVAALELLARLRTGSFAGLSPCPADLDAGAEALVDRLVECAVRELDGIAGSSDQGDATALVVLAETDRRVALRLSDGLRRIQRDGAPLMQGAAAGTRLRLALQSPAVTAHLVGGWISGASGPASRAELRQRLAGLLITAGGLLEAVGSQEPTADAEPRDRSASHRAEPQSADDTDAGGSDQTSVLAGIASAIESCSDAYFVSVLPALRGGFDALSPADRDRLLRSLAEVHRGVDTVLTSDPEELARIAAADVEARGRLAALGLADVAFSPAERWRLVLGRQRDSLSGNGSRMASSLDQLYGLGSGEGLPAEQADRAGGSDRSTPSTREWGDDLDALFGPRIRDEVVAEAVARGHTGAVDLLDPDSTRPSVELLSTVLSLAGALPESRLARLRPLIGRLVDELTRELANRIRPALAGLSLPTPTRRDTGVIDLARTVDANLHRVVLVSGQPQLVVETPIFRQRGAREADWHVIVVVDVSGSMEASTVFAAITSAILAGVRCLRVSFVTFSTEVMDLSETVSDPLALLLEISVGGGTSISAGLRYAETLITVPTRTLLALVTDFEEGGPIEPMLARIRSLSAAGVALIGCAALDDTGVAAYHVSIASSVAAAGMPVAAVSPQELARWVGDVVNR